MLVFWHAHVVWMLTAMVEVHVHVEQRLIEKNIFTLMAGHPGGCGTERLLLWWQGQEVWTWLGWC
jgi:hypothetical protein